MEKSLCTLPDGGRLIETFGWTPGNGVARLALHLARLERSANVLGVKLDSGAVDAQVSLIQSNEALRCRLTVAVTGEVELTTVPMPPAATTWKIAVSDERVNSHDLYLGHKTTQRDLYDRSRAAMPVGIDEVIFLNERDEVCEGTISNVLLKRDGRWVTPLASCGCLPGVYRQSLLDAGHLNEAVITLNDLKTAEEIRVCNSLRGEIQAALA